MYVVPALLRIERIGFSFISFATVGSQHRRVGFLRTATNGEPPGEPVKPTAAMQCCMAQTVFKFGRSTGMTQESVEEGISAMYILYEYIYYIYI